MDDVFFVDSEGNRISCEGISSHIALANCILEQNQELKERFEKSNQQDPCDFLVYAGYLKVSDLENYRKVTYYSPKISRDAAQFLLALIEDGFNRDDLFYLKLMQKQREEGRE